MNINKFNIPIYYSLYPYIHYVQHKHGFITNIDYNIKCDLTIINRLFNKQNKSYAIYGIKLTINKTK